MEIVNLNILYKCITTHVNYILQAFHGESCDAKDGNSTAIKSTNVHHQDIIWKALPIACTIYAFYLIHLISENCLVNNYCSNYLFENIK